MRRARTWGWRRTRRYDDPSNDLGPSSSHQSYPAYIINTCGYDFREGQVVVDAVGCEPASASKFPDNRENNREFCRIRPSTAIFMSDQRADSMPYSGIPYATEQGIFKRVSGNFFRGTGNLGILNFVSVPEFLHRTSLLFPSPARTRIGQLSSTSLVCTFDDLPKPILTAVLGLQLGVESRVIRNTAIGRQSRSEDRRAGQVASGIWIGF
jgi:hypothetical protein